MKKIVFGLVTCGILLNFESNGEDSEFSSSTYHSYADFNSDSAKFSESLAEFKRIKANLDSMKFSQKINELEKCLTRINNILSDMGRRWNQARVEGNEIPTKGNFDKNLSSYYENQLSIETFEKNLRGFNSALQNTGTRFNTILNKGHKLFDDKSNKQLFNPENISGSKELENLFGQIYDIRYPDALRAWFEIRYMESADPKYNEKIKNFKETIRLLYRDVQRIKSLDNPADQNN